jgi:integrase
MTVPVERTHRQPTQHRGKGRGNGDGSIYQREDGTWCAALKDRAGKRKVLYGRSRKDVADKLKKALSVVQERRPLLSVQLKADRFVADWLEESVKLSHKPLTYEKYEQVIRIRVLPVIGRLPLARVGPEHVRTIQAKMLADGLSVATVNGMRTALGAALAQAEKWDLVARNAVRLVDPPHAPEQEPVVLRPDEATAFLAAAQGDIFAPMFTIMLATGLRPGEARGLRWADVELSGPAPAMQVRQQSLELKGKRRVFGDPKSRHGRRAVPLIAIALGALKEQRKRVAELRLLAGPVWQDNDLVFPDEIGQPLGSRRVRDHFARIAARAALQLLGAHGDPEFSTQLDEATPHALRHSTGTFLLAAGVPERTVQAILGHGSAAMTRRYLHVLPTMLSDAGARLDAFFSAAAAGS